MLLILSHVYYLTASVTVVLKIAGYLEFRKLWKLLLLLIVNIITVKVLNLRASVLEYSIQELGD